MITRVNHLVIKSVNLIAGLAIIGVAGQSAIAQTLNAAVRASDWQIVSWIDDGVAKLNIQSNYGTTAFYGGKFTKVVFWNETYTVSYGQLNPCNNVFKIFNCVASVLDVGYYSPPGNGVNGEVIQIAIGYGGSDPGDVYVGGSFTSAGGFPYSANIGVYRRVGGWQSQYIWSASHTVTQLTWQQNNTLRVFGPQLTTVYGPLFPGDTGTNAIDVSGTHAGFWHDRLTDFVNGWWTTN